MMFGVKIYMAFLYWVLLCLIKKKQQKIKEINNMRVEIIDSKGNSVKPINDRVIELLDDETFKARVYNNRPTRVQLDLYMNGKVDNPNALVASLILAPFSGGEIERGETNHDQFTFKAKKETNLNQLIATSEDDWGLVCVRFRDEYQSIKQQQPVLYRESFESFCVDKDSTGGIVCSGYSNQEFGTTHPIKMFGSYDQIFAYRLHEKKYRPLQAFIPNYIYP